MNKFFVFVIGLFLGLGLALVLVTYKSERTVLVNYSSGSVRFQYHIGPIMLFDDVSPRNIFEGTPPFIERNGVANNAWIGAFGESGPPWARITYDYEGGRVLYDIGRLINVFPRISTESATNIKQEYLNKLAKAGPGEASSYVDEVLDSHYAEILNDPAIANAKESR